MPRYSSVLKTRLKGASDTLLNIYKESVDDLYISVLFKIRHLKPYKSDCLNVNLFSLVQWGIYLDYQVLNLRAGLTLYKVK